MGTFLTIALCLAAPVAVNLTTVAITLICEAVGRLGDLKIR